MGYILPVNHYDYYDYQKRIIKDNPDPIHIERPYKTISAAAYHHDQNGQHPVKPGDAPESVRELAAAEKLYAELTGKGRHFSSVI